MNAPPPISAAPIGASIRPSAPVCASMLTAPGAGLPSSVGEVRGAIQPPGVVVGGGVGVVGGTGVLFAHEFPSAPLPTPTTFTESPQRLTGTEIGSWMVLPEPMPGE